MFVRGFRLALLNLALTLAACGAPERPALDRSALPTGWQDALAVVWPEPDVELPAGWQELGPLLAGDFAPSVPVDFAPSVPVDFAPSVPVAAAVELPAGWQELNRFLSGAPAPSVPASVPAFVLAEPVAAEAEVATLPERPLETGGPELELLVPPGEATRLLAGSDHAALAPRVETLYAANNHHPLFLNPHYGSAPTTRALRFLLALHELGLDPFEYHLDHALKLAGESCRIHFSEPEETVPEVEDALRAFVADAPPPLVSIDCKADWWPGDTNARELDVVLSLAWVRLAETLAERPEPVPFPGAERAVATLVSLLPRSERYWGRVAALRGLLPHWARGTFPTMGKWGPLKPGDFGPRVARLKRRLVVEGYLEEGQAEGHWKTFDSATREAVLAWREAYGLPVKGTVDHAMLAVLAEDADHYVKRVWQSLNETLVHRRERGDTYVLVNIPEFMTYFVEDGRVTAAYRSVVGFPYEEPGGRTPTLDAAVQYVDINPTWTPTPYVLENELKKKARREADFFARNGFEQRGGKWVQRPGPANTLGQVVIGFPNDNNISLHGTNDPKPFGFADRALSHGCIRVEGIEELARRILDWAGQAPATSLETLFSRVIERRVDLAQTLPVHIVYDPVRVVEGRTVALTRDPYKLHRRAARQNRLDSLLRVVSLARQGRKLVLN